jgi:hypothetical protein
MRRPRRRPMHYTAFSLYDGTVIAARPIRKPIFRTKRQEEAAIDQDGVCQEWLEAGKELSDINNEGRTRFLDIISTRLNTRRAIREMVIPHLVKMESDIEELRKQIEQLHRLLAKTPS